MLTQKREKINMGKWLNEIGLEGKNVKLIPLREHHKEALLEAASDGELWELWFTAVPSKKNIMDYIHFAFEEYKADKTLPFVVVDKKTNKVIGATRYCNSTPQHRRLEIGYTWYSKSYQRTGVNTECKQILLTHAFEVLNCTAVEFRTHFQNTQSRNAIARLGAKQDGILRNHQIDSEGLIRDTVVFSIINSEWATIKKSLEFKMKKYEEI